MKIAVTGASGHIGNCLVRQLTGQGIQIKVLVHNFRNDLDELGIELIQGDLLDQESLNTLCKDADVVFHLAARIALDNRSAERVYATNVTGTANMIQAARTCGVKKFIHFSSIDAFQPVKSPEVLDESRPLIESKRAIYAYSKAESERILLDSLTEEMEVVILSPTAVIGPFDYRGSILGQALKTIYQGKLPFLVSGGYNWVDVRDVVAAAIQAIELGRNGERYILAGNFCNLKELSSQVSELSGRRAPLFVPLSLARLACPFFQLYSAMTKKEPLYTSQSLDLLESSPANISSSKAQKVLGYEPRPLMETLVETFDWYHQKQFLS